MKHRLPLFAALFLCLALAMPARAETTEMQAESASGVVMESPEVAAEEAAPQSAKEMGFPQLKIETYASQIFWMAFFFAVLYGLMSKIALPKVAEVIEMRSERRSDMLDQAATAQEKAEGMKAAYESGLAQAQDESRKKILEMEQAIADNAAAESARFGDHARQRIVTTEQSITKAKQEALQSIADISAEISAEMVNKITGSQLTKADAKKAVASVMQKG